MHTSIINTTLFTLCHSDMFQPSKGHLLNTTDTVQQNELPNAKFNLVSSVCCLVTLHPAH